MQHIISILVIYANINIKSQIIFIFIVYLIKHNNISMYEEKNLKRKIKLKINEVTTTIIEKAKFKKIIMAP